jgi:putative heme transporter
MVVNPSTDSVPPQIKAAAGWAWRLIVIAVAAALVIYAVLHLKLLFVVLFVAVALTAILVPLRRLFERIGLNRSLSTTATLLLSIVLLVGIFSLLGRALAGQTGEIADAFTQGVTDVREWLREGPLQLSDNRINEYIDQATQAVSDNQSGLLSGAIGFTSTAVEVVTGAFLVLFTVIFFLYDGRGIWNWFVNLFPRRAHESMHEASALGWAALTGYVRGTAIIALVDAVLIGIGIAIVGVPLALPLAVLVFFGAFIPIVGALVAGFIAVAVALATEGLVAALIVLAIIVGVQQLEGHILQPLVMGKLVKVHPLGVVLAVTAGSVLLGILGAVVAVPIVAVAATVLGYYGHRARARNDALAASAAQAAGRPQHRDDRAAQAAGREETAQGDVEAGPTADEPQETLTPDDPEPREPEAARQSAR